MAMRKNTKSIEMTFEQIDAIVVGELKTAVDACFMCYYSTEDDPEEPDWKLIDALVTSIGYFTPMHEHEAYKRDIATRKVMFNNELMSEDNNHDSEE